MTEMKIIYVNIMDLHRELRKDERHNYVGLQVPVQSKLNAEKWASYLADYWDWQLLLLVKYGFPLDLKEIVLSVMI